MADRPKTLTPSAFERTRRAVLEVERQRHGLAHDPQLAAAQSAGMTLRGAVRFRLATPLEPGRDAIGRMMRRVPGDEPGTYHYVPTHREEMLFAPGLCAANVLPEGAEVTAVPAAGGGWIVVTSEQWGRLAPSLSDDEDVDLRYAVVRIGHAITGLWGDDPTYEWSPLLSRPGEFQTDSGTDYWNDSYAFLTGYDPPSKRNDLHPDEDQSAALRAVPYTTTVPARVRYTPFDGTYAGQTLPPSVVDALGTHVGAHPRSGQLWAPSSDCTLQRSVRLLELWWWQVCAPEWVPDTFTVRNPDFHLEWNPDKQEWEDPEGDESHITREYWTLPLDCRPYETWHTGIPATEDPPTRGVYAFIAPVGWWATYDWGWSWFFTSGYVRYRNLWLGSPYARWYGPNLYWGPWSASYWMTRWGDTPPSERDLTELTADPTPPTPPCGGIQRRDRYGFVMWEFGWPVESIDPGTRTCLITSTEMQVRRRIVVEHGPAPEFSCDEGYDR